MNSNSNGGSGPVTRSRTARTASQLDAESSEQKKKPKKKGTRRRREKDASSSTQPDNAAVVQSSTTSDAATAAAAASLTTTMTPFHQDDDDSNALLIRERYHLMTPRVRYNVHHQLPGGRAVATRTNHHHHPEPHLPQTIIQMHTPTTTIKQEEEDGGGIGGDVVLVGPNKAPTAQEVGSSSPSMMPSSLTNNSRCHSSSSIRMSSSFQQQQQQQLDSISYGSPSPAVRVAAAAALVVTASSNAKTIITPSSSSRWCKKKLRKREEDVLLCGGDFVVQHEEDFQDNDGEVIEEEDEKYMYKDTDVDTTTEEYSSAVFKWVQCQRCSKWRKMPFFVPLDSLFSSTWHCEMNVHDLHRNSCAIPEEEWKDEMIVTNEPKKEQDTNKSSSAIDDIHNNEEDAPSLKRAWNEQNRLRRVGKWSPSGGWKPPSWATTTTASSSSIKARRESCDDMDDTRILIASPTASCKPIRISDTISTDTTMTSSPKQQPMKKKIKATAAGASCRKGLLQRATALMAENPEIHWSPTTGQEDTTTTTRLIHLRSNYAKVTPQLLTRAHWALESFLPSGDCDSLDVVWLARQYYDYWRPNKGEIRVILLAESHAFTHPNKAFGSGLDPSMVKEYTGPRNFLGLVNCLAYGESEALVTYAKLESSNGGQQAVGLDDCPDSSNSGATTEKNVGTTQFWTLLAACARGTEYIPNIIKSAKKSHLHTSKFPFAVDILKSGGLSVEDRLRAKLDILQSLKDRGIWLLDASIIGWYITQPQKYRRSKKTLEIHRMTKERPPKDMKAPSVVLSWEMFTKHLIREVANEGALQLVIPIGKEIEAILSRERLEEAAKTETQSESSLLSTTSHSCIVAESFPAPNAWITGGYGPWYAKMARMVEEAAPPLKPRHRSVHIG